MLRFGAIVVISKAGLYQTDHVNIPTGFPKCKLKYRIQDNTGTRHACIPPRQHPTWTKKRWCRRRQRPHPTRPVRVAWPHCQALPDHVGPARLSTWTACGGGAPTVTRNGGGEPVVTCRAPETLTASRLSTRRQRQRSH